MPHQVSYVITVYNKVDFLGDVLRSIELDSQSLDAEVIFVDDGSSDGSVEMIQSLTANWALPVKIVQQSNQGASAATNAGVAAASRPWIRLLDGDDLLVPGSTLWLIEACISHSMDFAYGDLEYYQANGTDPLAGPFSRPEIEIGFDGLARFIRNCPGNSSSILVKKSFFEHSGGCHIGLVSPDQLLFLRLFRTGPGVHLTGAVALLPPVASGRLSSQTLRSRYETLLAFHILLTEPPGLSRKHAKQACRRALARAYRYNRKVLGRNPLSQHLLWYVLSKLWVSKTPERAIYRALGALTESGSTERPDSWKPGAIRESRR